MCRLAAYLGEAISLQALIIDPEHSLIEQSLEAQEAKLSVNGDGFGVAWYGEFDDPGVFKHTQPAWSDQNLLSIAKHIKSTSILAHVRAATDGAIVHTNCHPFTYGQWAFAHNGQVGEFPKLRRVLENALPDELYARRQATTDSELLFLLMVGYGLENDPITAIQSMIALVISAARAQSVQQPFKFTAVCTTKERLLAIRYASFGHAPTLYCAQNTLAQGTVIASESLTQTKEHWREVAASTIMVVEKQAQKSWPIVVADAPSHH